MHASGRLQSVGVIGARLHHVMPYPLASRDDSFHHSPTPGPSAAGFIRKRPAVDRARLTLRPEARRAEQHLLSMFSTKSAQSLCKLFADYIEPPTLSRQQSHKLLSGLKTSFRNQLAQEHRQSPGNGTEPRPSAASQHLRSILSNPLFSYVKPSSARGVASPPPDLKRDPMEVFDHAVARGLMTFKAATGCLMAKKRLTLTWSPAPEADSASTETAARVVRWLRSSGAEKNLNFLRYQSFVRSLLPFLLSERLEAVAWDWIARLINDDKATWSTARRAGWSSFLLAELVAAKSQLLHGDLDVAIGTMLEAERRFQSSPLLPQLLMLAWRSISWRSTVEAHSTAPPSERLFDAHLDTARVHLPPRPIESAHLWLHHPTRPNLDPAMLLLGDRRHFRELVLAIDWGKRQLIKASGMSKLLWLACLGRDTTTHLTRLGRDREATDVTELLRSELPDVAVDGAAAV
ncbi:hypothetical protein XA68_13761 [Ophiocordyceps unilateralis]|uniref:Uncharacterized protein n=1 Tax=Ophiocordyceps unilateralis TaxID=268505 RepID=A0A2A9PC09_OPHUN|nr:hypothetical protein XA68_13761 [Ophiocordyceps unilateralis]